MRPSSERGAVLMEVALVVPLLVILFLGVAELGFHVRDTQNVTAASQAGARVLSSSGDSRLADYDALMALSAPLTAFDASQIERIIVFAAGSDGEMPDGCDTKPQKGKCNHYDSSSFSLTPADFTGTKDCGVADPDRKWCPLDRETDQGKGTDWIGVRIDVRHTSIAPFIPDRTIVDTTVMRIEPRFEP